MINQIEYFIQNNYFANFRTILHFSRIGIFYIREFLYIHFEKRNAKKARKIAQIRRNLFWKFRI